MVLVWFVVGWTTDIRRLPAMLEVWVPSVDRSCEREIKTRSSKMFDRSIGTDSYAKKLLRKEIVTYAKEE